MLAAGAPPSTGQQCTPEVGALLETHAKAAIPPPLTRKRFKMVRPGAAPAAVEAPPLGTAAPEAAVRAEPEKIAPEVGAIVGADMGAEAVMEAATAREPVPELEMEGVPPQVLAAASGDLAAVAEMDAEDAARATTDAVEEITATEDALQGADAALAEFMALAEDVEVEVEAVPEVAVPEVAVAEVPVAEVAASFPPAEAWIPPTSSIAIDAIPEVPRGVEFPGQLARAVRTIQDWFTGVPFLRAEERPAPVATASNPVPASGALSRALRTIDANAISFPAATSSPSISMPSMPSDVYDMNPMELIPAPPRRRWRRWITRRTSRSTAWRFSRYPAPGDRRDGGGRRGGEGDGRARG